MTDGRLPGAGGHSLDETVLVWNGVVARVPALVVQPTSVHEIAEAVAFARDHGLMLNIASGSRNPPGTSITERAVTLDLSSMRTISVDRDAGLVHVGPGCSPRDVKRAAQEQGLAVPLGFLSATVAAEQVPDADFGYLAYHFGWTPDDLAETEIVTTDGVARIANRHENARVFSAIRSGARGVGVVTRLTLQARRHKHAFAGDAGSRWRQSDSVPPRWAARSRGS